PAITVIVGRVHPDRDFGLPDRQDALVFEPRQRAGERHVGGKHRAAVLRQAMDRGVDAIAGTLDLALAGKARAVVTDFHEAARRHLGPIEAERDLVVAVVRARHPEGQVIEDALVEAVHHAQPVRGREIDAGLPARGFEVYALVDGFLQHDVASRENPFAYGSIVARIERSEIRGRSACRITRVSLRSTRASAYQSGWKFIATPLMQ